MNGCRKSAVFRQRNPLRSAQTASSCWRLFHEHPKRNTGPPGTPGSRDRDAVERKDLCRRARDRGEHMVGLGIRPSVPRSAGALWRAFHALSPLRALCLDRVSFVGEREAFAGAAAGDEGIEQARKYGLGAAPSVLSCQSVLARFGAASRGPRHQSRQPKHGWSALQLMPPVTQCMTPKSCELPRRWLI